MLTAPQRIDMTLQLLVTAGATNSPLTPFRRGAEDAVLARTAVWILESTTTDHIA